MQKEFTVNGAQHIGRIEGQWNGSNEGGGTAASGVTVRSQTDGFTYRVANGSNIGWKEAIQKPPKITIGHSFRSGR